MKTKLKYLIRGAVVVALLALQPFGLYAQNGPCNTPPNCIVNGDLGANSTGDVNSSAATTVNGWFVSHGSPTVFGNDCPTGSNLRSIWMWSYSGNGEGVYSCYNFQAGRTYQVCLWVRNTNTVANGGQLLVRATNGFTNIGPTGSGVPAPASVQTIGTNPGNNMTWTQLTYTFTPTATYSQLWIYPLMTNGPLNNQQYELQIDDVRVEPVAPQGNPTISASPSTITWCGSSTLSVSGAAAGSTITWAPSVGLSSTSGATVTAAPCATTTYTATVTPPASACPTCTAPATVVLTQQVTVTQPSFSIIGNTTLACGNNLTLSVVPNLFCNELTYSWTGPNGFNTIGNGFSIPNVTAANAGVYTVVITNANGNCSTTLSVNVTITCVPCATPPNCIVNGDLGATNTGDVNSSVPTTVNGWFVSHGSPTVFGNDCPTGTNLRSIWMWSYSGNGEGVYTCYNFQANNTYQVCFWVRNTNGVANGGQLFVRATNGFTNVGPTGSAVPAPATVQTIGTNPGNNMAWTQITYTFTASQNFSQLWFYPLMTNGPLNNQQYELQIDDIRVQPAVSAANLSISASPASIAWCGNSTLSVAGVPPGATVTWAPATGLSSTTGATVTASPCVTTTYTATVTPATVQGCPTCAGGAVTLTQQVTVTQPTVSITGATLYQCGSTLTLTANPALSCAAVTYSWTGPNGFTGTGSSISIPNVNTPQSGTYSVVITNANGNCTVSASVNVTVSCVPCTVAPNCIVNGDLGATSTGDVNSSVATTVNGWYVSHGSPTVFGNDCPTGTNSRSIWMWSYSGNGEGVYTCYNFQANNTYQVCFWVRNTNGVANGGQLFVRATNGFTNVGPTGNGVPAPATVQTIGTNPGNNMAWTQITYTFTASQNFSQLWFYPLMTNGPLNNQQYELQIDDIRVQPALSAATMSISASPAAITWCGSSTLSVAGVPAGATVTWAPATGLSATTGATVTASPCATTTYTATVTLAPVAGCPSCANAAPVTLTQQVVVTQPAFAISGSTSYKCGDNLSLFVNPSLFCNEVSYTWTGPNGFSYNGPGFSIPSVTELNAGVYTVVITNANGGCSTTLSVNVEVDCPCEAKPDFTWDGCNPINFYGTNGSGSTVVSWFWDFGDGQTSTLQNPTHVYGAAGSYKVCLTILAVNSKGETCCTQVCHEIEACKPEDCGVKADFQYFYTPSNPFNIVFVDASSTTGGTICSYTVDYGDGSPLYSGPTLPATHLYPTIGAYTVCIDVVVCVYDAFGNIIDRCSDRVCRTVNVGLSPARETSTSDLGTEIQVYPSPAATMIHILFSDVEQATVRVYNAAGQQVGTATQGNKNMWHMDVSKLAPGVYFVVAQDREGNISKEAFVKE